MAGNTASLKHLWTKLTWKIDLAAPTESKDQVFLGCTQRERETNKGIVTEIVDTPTMSFHPTHHWSLGSVKLDWCLCLSSWSRTTNQRRRAWSNRGAHDLSTRLEPADWEAPFCVTFFLCFVVVDMTHQRTFTVPILSTRHLWIRDRSWSCDNTGLIDSPTRRLAPTVLELRVWNRVMGVTSRCFLVIVHQVLDQEERVFDHFTLFSGRQGVVLSDTALAFVESDTQRVLLNSDERKVNEVWVFSRWYAPGPCFAWRSVGLLKVCPWSVALREHESYPVTSCGIWSGPSGWSEGQQVCLTATGGSDGHWSKPFQHRDGSCQARTGGSWRQLPFAATAHFRLSVQKKSELLARRVEAGTLNSFWVGVTLFFWSMYFCQDAAPRFQIEVHVSCRMFRARSGTTDRGTEAKPPKRTIWSQSGWFARTFSHLWRRRVGSPFFALASGSWEKHAWRNVCLFVGTRVFVDAVCQDQARSCCVFTTTCNLVECATRPRDLQLSGCLPRSEFAFLIIWHWI